MMTNDQGDHQIEIESAHPHGVLGYVLADPVRTRNALRLAHWVAPTVVLTIAIVAAALVGLALFSPLAAAGLLGGGSTATVGGLALHHRRRQRAAISAQHPPRGATP
jgi:hypothetical protein